MGYITSSTHIISLLVANILQILAITTRFEQEVSPSRNLRRHIGTLPFPDWELGLREAVYQALLRERNLHPNLREYLHSAPLLGRQDSASPFGDIAILARGQLYSAPGGFQFIQDPYQNDCEGCHNPPLQCGRVTCEKWRPQDHERLLALWTVKRIRHRDATYGYRYELEYKITPMSVVASEPFVTRNGNFDYSVPGHTFIVQADPRQAEPTFHRLNQHHDKGHGSSNQYSSDHWSPNYGGPNFDAHYLPPPPLPVIKEYYGEEHHSIRPQDPNRYQNVLYAPPEQYTKRPPYVYYSAKNPHSYDSKETELYKNLIETLSSKTSTMPNAPLTTTSTEQPFEFELFPKSLTPQQITTQTSPQPTTHTTSQLSSPTTSTLRYQHPTSSRIPILPTIPIQPSVDTTPFLQETSSTKHMEDIFVTNPQYTSTMIRFPTTTSNRLKTPNFRTDHSDTTPTTRFSESTRYVKYSEPDPLYTTTITPTLPTLTSKSYATRTTKLYKLSTRKYKTTQSIDFDLFGDDPRTTTAKKSTKKYEKMKFSDVDHAAMEPGEQVITVVNPPSITSKINKQDDNEPGHTMHPSKSKNPSQNHEIDFGDTKQLPPEGEPYITIPYRPSTRVQQHSTPEITASTERSIRYEPTTRKVTTQSSPTKSTSSTSDSSKSITMANTLVSTESSTHLEFTNADTTSIKSSLLPRRTTPLTYKSASSTKIRTPLTTVITTTKRTVPFKQITRIPSTTKTTAPSTVTTTTIKTTEKPSTTLLTTMATSTEQKLPIEPTESATNNDTTFTSASPLETTFFSVTDSMIASKTDSTTPELIKSVNISDSTTYLYEITTTSDDTTTFLSDTPKTTTASSKLSTIPVSTLPTSNTVLSTSTVMPTTTLRTRVTEISKQTSSLKPPSVRSTKRPTQKTAPPRQNTKDDFLVDDAPKKQNMKFQEEDFELDIFGKPQDKQPSKSDKKTEEHKKPLNSKEIDDIFGSQYDDKQSAQKTNTDDYRTTKKPKIIFSNFYSPSTPTDETTRKDLNITETTTRVNVIPSLAVKGEITNKTSESEPLSSNRYNMSESVVKNKNKNNTSISDFLSDIEFEPTIKTKLQEMVPKKSEYEISKTKFPETTQTPLPTYSTVTDGEVDNNKIFDALALSVVNHARSIDYLNSNNCSTTKEQKYKRRSTYRVRKLRRRN